ncbi:CoA transferase [Alcaligenaceae bacterium]|nr:CoA transferase [Alcaligenaceae bacterium]
MTDSAFSPSQLLSRKILADLWSRAELPDEALECVTLVGADPVFPSSFRVGLAAQTTVAAAALAACELGVTRGMERQGIGVDMAHAACECSGWYSLDGVYSDPWNPFTGLYPCKTGWVRVHANLRHHREGFLRLLGLDPDTAERAAAEAQTRQWPAIELETRLAESGLVGTALRSFDEWDATPQGQTIAQLPLFTIKKIGDAAPQALPALGPEDKPLTGIRYLDLTRILAGPIAGRAIAAYGADVLLLNAPYLPNIEAIVDTSRGKLSAHVDLKTDDGKKALRELLQQAHVMVQGYRPGGLEQLGFGPKEAAKHRPGIVYVTLSAFGNKGPWAGRRGFDSLLQTAMGFNIAEQEAFGADSPKPMPMQILDESTGYLIAMLVSTVLRRQQIEGGSWHVEVSLAQTARWFRSLGRISEGVEIGKPDITPYLETSDSGYGQLQAVRHSAILSRTPAGWERPSMPPGSHPACWPPH